MRKIKLTLEDGLVYIKECPPDVVVLLCDYDQGEADYFELSRPV